MKSPCVASHIKFDVAKGPVLYSLVASWAPPCITHATMTISPTLVEDDDPADVLVITPILLPPVGVRCHSIGMLTMEDNGGVDAACSKLKRARFIREPVIHFFLLIRAFPTDRRGAEFSTLGQSKYFTQQLEFLVMQVC